MNQNKNDGLIRKVRPVFFRIFSSKYNKMQLSGEIM